MRAFRGPSKQRGYFVIPYVAQGISYLGSAIGGGAAAGGAAAGTAAGTAGTAAAAGTAASATAATATAATAATTTTGLGTAAAEAATSTLIGAGLSKLLSPKMNLNIPPAPGAPMVDSAASAARARQRQQQQIAGGINSTITNPVSQSSFNSSTGGQKSLLGQ